MKKNVIKKILAAALVASLSATLLAGCGSDAGSSNSGSTGSNSGSTSTGSTGSDAGSASGDKVKINVYRDSFNVATPDGAEVKAVEDAINAYIADKINVEISLTDIGSGEYRDKVKLALANNEINLLWTASWQEAIGTTDLYKSNSVYDITDLVKGTTLYTSIPEWVWSASAYDGKTYFVSCYKESAEGYDIMARKDLVDKYGWDMSSVNSLKDIEPMLEDCKNEGLRYPYLTQKTAMFYRYYLNDFDFFAQNSWIAVDRATDSVVDTVLTPQYEEFATLMAEWADKGYLSEDDVTKSTTDTTTQTQDWGFSWWTDVPVNAEANNRYQQEVVMAPVTDKWSHSTTTLGSCFTITSNSTEAQAKAAIDFLGLLYTDKALADIYTYGIEGVDFNYQADGSVKKTDAGKYNHSAWESCSVLNLSVEDGEPADKVDLYAKFNDSSKSSCASGFRFDKTPVEGAYTACTNVFDEFGFVLENGGYKASEVAQAIKDYQAALDEAGYQEVLAEAQAQYEAWKATR